MTEKYIQKDNMEVTELDGEWIILDTTNYMMTKLNYMGGYCWSLLNEVQTAETITHSVRQEFSPIENERKVLSDIKEFLGNLVQYGLIQNVD